MGTNLFYRTVCSGTSQTSNYVILFIANIY